MDPFFILDSPKSFEVACASLQQEVARAVEAATTAIIQAAAA